MTTHTFQEITSRRSVTGKCPVCGRKAQRTQTFYATVNPYNRGADGIPLTAGQVREQVLARADAWVPDFRHGGCRSAG